MPSFDECLILLPCSTLEDFPSDASTADARNILAGWTVLWHPRLIATTRQNPAWYRADSPPEPKKNQLIVVPSLSQSKLPESYELRFQATEGSVWLSGNSRSEMLATLGLTGGPAVAENASTNANIRTNEVLEHGGRTIGPEDFFAFGYGMLQVQVMTRRLRYTSNLDEIHVQKRIVAAAEAFVAGDAEKAIDSLHQAFDSLAEERDHYFSADPALLDVTLLTPATLLTLFAAPSFKDARLDEATMAVELPSGQLATPENLIMDAAVIAAIQQKGNDPATQNLLARLHSGRVGWAGGGPAGDVVMDTLTFRGCHKELETAHAAARETVGSAPKVYARLSGSTPTDLTRSLVSLGYVGITPIDFTGGTGFGDEPKVMRRDGGAEIQALTARPMDANNDSTFLSLAPRLGEMIDAGEVATGILAHWPGSVCDSYRDLRQLASWSLALGKFWTLENYFTQGEHPYHHNNGSSQSPEAAQRLVDCVAEKLTDPISRVVRQTRESVTELRDELLQGMLALASGKVLTTATPIPELARALGGTPIEPKSIHGPSDAVIVLNPYPSPQRMSVRIAGPAISEQHIYGVSRESGHTVVTLDVPACGFAGIRTATDSDDEKSIASTSNWLSSLFKSSPKRIADANSLRNEFMEVMIDSKTGGIQGVYSGPVRGNRFSMRLVLGDRETTSRCDKIRVLESTPSSGSIETAGTILDSNQATLATFTLVFTLTRGNRVLSLSGKVNLNSELTFDTNPWSSYIAARVAVATDTGMTRAILRDKLHRTSGRRLVAPLGVVTDEADRQTLIASAGLAFHRRVDDRFVDTLLIVSGESSTQFELHYGFDVNQPIELAKSLIAPAAIQPIGNALRAADGKNTVSSWPSRGWLLHASPKDVSVIGIQAHPRSDSQLALVMTLIRTRSTGGNTTLRFCRNVKFATVWSPELANSSTEVPVDVSPSAADKQCSVTFDGDTVKAALSGHQVLELLVILA